MTWVLQAPHQLLVELQVCILLPEAQSMDGMVGGINSSSITGSRVTTADAVLERKRHGSLHQASWWDNDSATHPNLSLSMNGQGLAMLLFFPSSLDNCVFIVKLTDGSFSVSGRQMVSEEGGKSLARKCQPALLVPKLQHMPALCKAAPFPSRKVQGSRTVNQ